MSRDAERVDRLCQAMRKAGLDLLACALPVNVRLVSGYWPVVGTSVVLAARDGTILLIAPEDERGLADRGWADAVYPFQPSSLSDLRTAADALRRPLREAAARLGIGHGKIGYEENGCSEPASYAAMHLYGASLRQLLGEAFSGATVVGADAMLTRLRSVKTPRELEGIRVACRAAELAFGHGAIAMQPGMSEAEVAHRFAGPLSIDGLRMPDVARAGGFVYCMSGPNSAQAGGAYARSRTRPIAAGDLVLVHCNSYVDGHWTDITRTYCLGPPDGRQQSMYAAVDAARSAALAAIRPGASAKAVDHAARSVLDERGFGKEFPHSTGHGVGFGAIDASARPRLHPASDDVLEAGMVFNVEPAIYIHGFGGLRHCDMVAVSRSGAEVLTPFQASADELVLAGARTAGAPARGGA